MSGSAVISYHSCCSELAVKGERLSGGILMRLPSVGVLAVAVVAAVALAGCSASSSGKGTPAAASGSSAASASSGGTAPSSASASGSGSSSQSVNELYLRARAALETAPSVRVAGTVVSGGASTSLDLAYAKTGTSGSVTEAGTKIDLIVIKPSVYFKAPDDFWRKQLGTRAASVLPIVTGKWIKAPLTNPEFGKLGDAADKDKFVAQIFDNTTVAELSTTPGKTIDGHETIGLKDKDGSTLYIAKDDSRPLQIEPAANSKDSGKITFSQYGSAPEPTPPPAASTLDVSKLGS